MKKYGYNITEEALDKKFRNMKQTFKTTKRNKSSSGRGRITWEYFDIFEHIFLDDRTINFGPTISSMKPPTPSSSSLSSVPCLSPPTQTPSQLIHPILSSLPSRAPSPSRYVRHTSPTRNCILEMTKIATFFPDSFDLMCNPFSSSFSYDSFCSSSSSSLTTASECAYEKSPERFPSRRHRKNNVSKDKYNQRNRLITIENERVTAITELKKSIDESNRIQQKRNEILEKMLQKM